MPRVRPQSCAADGRPSQPARGFQSYEAATTISRRWTTQHPEPKRPIVRFSRLKVAPLPAPEGPSKVPCPLLVLNLVVGSSEPAKSASVKLCPARSASCFCIKLCAVCINVSGLRVLPRPGWGSRAGILIITTVCHDHSLSPGFAAAAQLSGHLLSTTRRQGCRLCLPVARLVRPPTRAGSLVPS